MSGDDQNKTRRSDQRPRVDADHGREPHLVPAQSRGRLYSMAALVERIEAAFYEEYSPQSSPLREADTSAKRLKLVLETADHVLAVESVRLSPDEKADLVRRAYSSLFGYGPLDPLLMDERVTTISLEGADHAAVRYGHGDLVSLEPLFLNAEHMQRFVNRLVSDAGAELRPEEPYLEAGLAIGRRPVCINLVAPPVVYQLSADIRLHPETLPTLDDLISNGFLTAEAARLVMTLIESSYGILVVGEPESGKTTLLSVLAQHLPTTQAVISVERAGELRLPPNARRFVVKWPVGDQPGITFGEQINRALRENPDCILLDEVRADESEGITSLLALENTPRQLWSFRSNIFAKRLQSALGMLARRADPAQGEQLILALYERLPFVLALNRFNGQLRLWSIGEWQFREGSDSPTYALLMHTEEGQLVPTGDRPARNLPGW